MSRLRGLSRCPRLQGADTAVGLSGDELLLPEDKVGTLVERQLRGGMPDRGDRGWTKRFPPKADAHRIAGIDGCSPAPPWPARIHRPRHRGRYS